MAEFDVLSYLENCSFFYILLFYIMLCFILSTVFRDAHNTASLDFPTVFIAFSKMEERNLKIRGVLTYFTAEEFSVPNLRNMDLQFHISFINSELSIQLILRHNHII